MNEPTVHIAVPPFARSMKTLSVVLVGLWLLEALIGHTGLAGSTPHPLGPFAALVLIPSRVAHGEVWRLVTHALVHDPSTIAGVLWTVVSLWFFGGAMEARWGLRRTLTAMVVASVVGALVVIAVGAVFTPFWTQPAYTPAAATAMLAGAWAMAQGTQPTSLLGLVTLSGRQLTALLVGFSALNFLLSRSPESVLGLVGVFVGVVLGNVREAPPPPTRARRESGPKLRVIKGGVDPRDLPN